MCSNQLSYVAIRQRVLPSLGTGRIMRILEKTVNPFFEKVRKIGAFVGYFNNMLFDPSGLAFFMRADGSNFERRVSFRLK